MKTRTLILVIAMVGICSFSLTDAARAGIASQAAEEVFEFFVKKGTREASEELAQAGGKAGIKALLESAEREGGEALIKRAAAMVREHGASAIKALQRNPSLYLQALETLPKTTVKPALWAIEREPEVMGKLVTRFGSDALELSVKHPGVWTSIGTKLGDDAITLGRKLNPEELMILARHADDMAALPKDQCKKVLEAILNNTKAVLTYLEKHPRILYTAAGVATVIALREDLIGSAEEVSIDKNGNKRIYKPGLVERGAKTFKEEIAYIFYVIAGLLGLWGLVYVHNAYALKKVKRQVKRLELEKQIAKTTAQE